MDLQKSFEQALALHQQGDLETAKLGYQQILAAAPEHFDASHLLGVALMQQGQTDVAETWIARALSLNPEFAAAHYNYGCVLKKLNKLEAALASFDKAIALVPDYADAYLNRGNVLRQLGRYEQALQSLDHSIALRKNNPEALTNRGNTLQDLKRFEEALESYSKALALKPDFAFALNNKAIALLELKRCDEALNELNKAIKFKPDFADSYNTKAVLFQFLKQFEDSLAQCNLAIAKDANYAAAYVNRGIVLWELRSYEAARDSYAQGRRINPSFDFLAGMHLNAKMTISDWEDFEALCSDIVSGLQQGQRVATPFSALALIDAPELHRAAAQSYVDVKSPAINKPVVFQDKTLGQKIRVGYYSADFYGHATASLMAELFEAHDPVQFEIFAFSFGPNRQDDMRQRVQGAFDQFFDVTLKSDREVAELSRALGIDIAIDLKGFTQDARTGIFAERCAPIQVNYLGYPGTMAAPYIDYLIADKTVIPEAAQKHYTEKIVYLPDSYQVNDSKRQIADHPFTRSELGLPEQGFVFCCFNNNYKILPETYDRWMRILKAVPGSVLWLLQDNAPAAHNLRAEAQKRGIDPQRLVFAPRMPLEAHLARHRQADLFLDTLPYNAHTTASDALWAGLPVLTLIGESFAARVAASLLQAIGLNELVTTRPEDFERLAIQLAQHPQKLADLRIRLHQNRATSPLFNGQQFARNLEAAYRQMVARHRQGLPPENLEIMPVSIGQPQDSATQPPKPQAATAQTHLRPFSFMPLHAPLQVMDVGASAITEMPVYKTLLDQGWAFLHAFEGDPRQIAAIQQAYPAHSRVHQQFLFDGSEQTLYIASGPSGMTSLLKPDPNALAFFNGFNQFGHVEKIAQVQTVTLDSMVDIPAIDFLKMDVQGAELTVLKHGQEKLKDCVAMQLEVSYVSLYENQPTLGDVDCWMREQGYIPHRFMDIKRWSIAPTIFNNNFRVPGNQLLESDIIYIKNPLKLHRLSDTQISKMAVLAHYAFGSIDLCVYLLKALVTRGVITADAPEQYLHSLAAQSSPPQGLTDGAQGTS